MKISGFTYIRNGFTYGYPFLSSIASFLPLVDELVIIAGDSIDGTTEALLDLKDPKIKIFHSRWDDDKRIGGSIFAQQTNLGLQHVTGDWAIHLQADEVIHENDIKKLKQEIIQASNNPKIEGLLFPYYHFWGDFYHIRNTRRTHRYEIRAFRNSGDIQSYKDSQGFRKFALNENTNNLKGEKLRVVKVNVPIYHYSYTRHPDLMVVKSNYFDRFWHNDSWLKENKREKKFDYNDVDLLSPFQGTHPKYMHEVIAKQNWDFKYDPSKSNMSAKDKILSIFEKLFKKRFFEYKNYKIIKP